MLRVNCMTMDAVLLIAAVGLGSSVATSLCGQTFLCLLQQHVYQKDRRGFLHK